MTLDRPGRRARGLIVLGHGASGSVDAPDLVAVRDAGLAGGFAVARITQPYRVAGKRMPPAAPVLDAAWVVAVTEARQVAGRRLPLVLGGRSSGARVACRTAASLGALGVLALAFPLHPPGRPEVTRAAELDPTRPTLVINGDRDPFGVPTADGLIRVEVRAGDRHDLRHDPPGVAAVAMAWLTDLVTAPK